jgi:hypothetical protein
LLAVDLGYTRQSNIIESLLKEIGGMLYRIMNPKQDIEAGKTIP